MPNRAYGARKGKGREGEGDGSPHPRGQRMGKGWIPAPSSLGQAPRGNNGSGCENDGLGREDGRWGKGMGPRIREDNGWGRDGFPPPSSLGQALRGNNGSGCENDGLGARMGGGGRGWVPASARTTDGEGMDSRPRLHEGRLYAGKTDREGNHKGWTSGARHGFPPVSLRG